MESQIPIDLEKHQVNSSTIGEVAYDKENKELYIHFHNGGTYRYLGVPKDIYDALREAPSVGKFHAVSIKHVYAYVRL